MKRTIVYYITAHGYGHGTRSCDILNALQRASPETQFFVKTDLPPAFLRSRLGPSFQWLPGSYDVGLVQHDALRFDLSASRIAVEACFHQAEECIATEAQWLRQHHIDAVVADLPALPLAAAQHARIPSIAVGNFGWDWIYEEFAKTDSAWQPLITHIRGIYQKTDLLLRLPFAEPMTSFPHRIDIPLLARPGTPRRTKIIRQTGADPRKTWAFLSFTALNLDAGALRRLAEIKDCQFFSMAPLTWPGSTVLSLRRDDLPFADALASMDLVITKPGFGIVSDCIVNKKPIVHSDRGNFREYPILVKAIERYCQQVPIDSEALYQGDLAPAIEAVQHAPEPQATLPTGGADRAAAAILARIDRPPRHASSIMRTTSSAE